MRMTPAHCERHLEGVMPKFHRLVVLRGHHVHQRTLPVGPSPWTSHSLAEPVSHNGLNSPEDNVVKHFSSSMMFQLIKLDHLSLET